MKKTLFLNEFYLKIIAYVFMTIDHLGIFISMYAYKMTNTSLAYQISNVFRILGRFAFPIIIFMIVEGVIHTRHFGKYMLRIGIIALSIMIFQILVYYLYDSSIETMMSPFIDLSLAAITVYLLKRKDKFTSLVALPIGFSLLCFIVSVYSRYTGDKILWLPFYVRADYSLIGTLLAVGFYFATEISVKVVNDKNLEAATTKEEIMKTDSYRFIANYISIGVIVIISILVMLTGWISIDNKSLFDIFNAKVQNWMIISLVPIIFYNGKRGYNGKWFKYGSYLYFPLHIIILFGIFLLIFGM